MAIAYAKLTSFPQSARKVRLVADLIRGKKVGVARGILRFTVKKSALQICKLLDSAAANASHAARERHERIDTDEMVITEIMVNEGRTLNRYLSGPRGRAMRIRKRSSQVELTIAHLK